MVEKQRLVRRVFWGALVLLLAVSFAFSESEQVWAQHASTIISLEDLDRAHVRSDKPNENYGEGNLHAKYELKIERSFIKYDFDVGDEDTGNIRLNDGDTVILHLDAETIDGVALVGVYSVSSNWDEDSITWANAPDSFWVYYGALSGSGDVDVTDAVDDEGILNLGLKIDVESGYINGCIEWDNVYLHGDYSPVADVVTRAYAMITSPQDGLFTEESKRIVTYELLGENLSQATFFHNGEETDIAPESGSITITLIPGDNVLEVRATNYAGTTASSAQVIVMFLPCMEATITNPPPMAFAGEGGTFVVSIVEVEGVVVSYPAVTEATIFVNEDTMTANVNNGYFAYTVTTLEEGLNMIRAEITDTWGNTASSGTVGVIYVPERLVVEVLSPADGYMTSTEVVTVEGSITHGRAVITTTLYLNGTANEVALILESDEGGDYSYSFSETITLREGENTFAVEGIDEIGDRGSSGTMSVILDTTPPQVEITTPANNYLTNTTTVLVTGTVDDPAVTEATVEVNGTGQTIAVVEGSFSGQVSLIEGTNTIRALALDPLGNEGSSQPVVVTYNSAAPTVSITSPAGGIRTNSDTVTVSYTIAGNATSSQFILNGVSEEISPESGSMTVTLIEGENTIEVQASNVTTTASSGVVTVVSDTTPPNISVDVSEPWEEVVVTVDADEELFSPPTVTVTTGTDTTNIDMALTGVRQWSGTYEIPEDGTYIVEAVGTDEAGNTSSSMSSFSREKETVSAFAGGTITVASSLFTVEIEISEEVTDQSISTVLRYEDPRLGRVTEPAIFVRVQTGVALRWAMTAMTVKAIYDPTKLPEDMQESSLLLYLWTPSKGGYVPVEGATVNTIENSITGTVRY